MQTEETIVRPLPKSMTVKKALSSYNIKINSIRSPHLPSTRLQEQESFAGALSRFICQIPPILHVEPSPSIGLASVNEEEVEIDHEGWPVHEVGSQRADESEESDMDILEEEYESETDEDIEKDPMKHLTKELARLQTIKSKNIADLSKNRNFKDILNNIPSTLN
jgi:hypothetical protein